MYDSMSLCWSTRVIAFCFAGDCTSHIANEMSATCHGCRNSGCGNHQTRAIADCTKVSVCGHSIVMIYDLTIGH